MVQRPINTSINSEFYDRFKAQLKQNRHYASHAEYGISIVLHEATTVIYV